MCTLNTHTSPHICVGLGQLSEADQYLSQAQWSVLRAPDCEAWLKSRLHRNLGLLATAKGSLAEARRHFAEDVSSFAGTLLSQYKQHVDCEITDG